MNYEEYKQKYADLEDFAAYAFVDVCDWIVAGRPVSVARLWHDVQVASKKLDNLAQDYVCGRLTE